MNAQIVAGGIVATSLRDGLCWARTAGVPMSSTAPTVTPSNDSAGGGPCATGRGGLDESKCLVNAWDAPYQRIVRGGMTNDEVLSR